MDTVHCHPKLQKLLIMSLLLGFIAIGCKGRLGVTAKPPPRFYKITGENVHGVDTVGSDHIWIVGSYGSIYHSMDGGKNWEPQNSGTENLLCAIDFINENVGWVAGAFGLILHTEDGGKNWVRQNTDILNKDPGQPGSFFQNNLFNLSFIDRQLGWAVGSMGIILKTTDGGKNWALQREQEDTDFNDVCFIDENTGWVVGEFGSIYRTDDGGKSWTRQKPPTLFVNVASEEDPWGDVPLALYNVEFIDENRGWVVGMSGALLRTEDGGQTWIDMRDTLDVVHPFYDIKIKGNLGWIVGGGGSYVLSQDGGKTWSLIGMFVTRLHMP
jgi:photosystem II stability/assembly factor-like uncharacterized protein